jgi:HAD superfamily hydrolase (TIGR01549 family)
MAMSLFNNIYHFVDRLGLDNFFVKLFPRKRKKEYSNFEKDRNLIDGVKVTLQVLHQRYKLGIVSARSEEGVRHFLELFSLEEFFDVIVSANTCYYTKPFPHPLLYAAQKIKIIPEKCLMVGDYYRGYSGRESSRHVSLIVCCVVLEHPRNCSVPPLITFSILHRNY